ncbi:MAG: GNAT family N-acetyltransferase [Litorimonas sp.]
MIKDIRPEHHKRILKLNAEFVYWLSPLDHDELSQLLSHADYARQADDATGVLIGYAHDVDYPDHWNLEWLRPRLQNFFYIDRIIIDGTAQGRGLGQALYADVAEYARLRGYSWLACEVNTVPDNPGSHAFHLRDGFHSLGEQSCAGKDKAVRYYAKALD